MLPSGSRCCRTHLIKQDTARFLKPTAIQSIRSVSNRVQVTTSEVEQLVNDVRAMALKPGLDWDTPGAMTDADYWKLVEITPTQFDDLLLHISDHLRNTGCHTVRTALAIFLTKMRTGMSHDLLVTLFRLPKHTISRCIKKCRIILMKTFVPQHLGCSHITRDAIRLTHTRPFAQKLF